MKKKKNATEGKKIINEAENKIWNRREGERNT